MRVITDMVRTEEDGKMNIEAGIQIVRLLRDEFKYTKPILCYTGPRFLEDNRAKLKTANLTNVYATARCTDAELWARFLGEPTPMKSLQTSMDID